MRKVTGTFLHETRHSDPAGGTPALTGARPISLLLALVLLIAISAGGRAFAQTSRLDGGWEFLADGSATLTLADAGRASGWRGARVGLSWNAQFDDLRDYMGVGWYRTKIEIPDLSDGRRAFLRFQAVDYFSEVF